MRNIRRVLSFDAEQARRAAFARYDRGIQTVEVARIVGSVGRATEIDRQFRYRRGVSHASRDARQRLARVRALFEADRVPALELYQIGDDLFVLDGHHRVAAAHERNQTYLEAHVIEFLPDRELPENAVYYERRQFIALTGLSGDQVSVTEPGRYLRLLNRIRDYRDEQKRRSHETSLPSSIRDDDSENRPTLHDAARHWHVWEYLPVVNELREKQVARWLPGRAMGDLYGYVCDHRWYLSERHGHDVGLEVALTDFVARHRPDGLRRQIQATLESLWAHVVLWTRGRGLAEDVR